MPVYLLHGFRWPRPLIRIHIILQNLDDAAAEWLINPQTTLALHKNFNQLYPDCMEHLHSLRFIEQYDPSDERNTSGSQPYAYVADMVEEVKLGVEIDEVRGRGVGNEQWASMMELRDRLAPEEKVAWYVVVCGDEERWAPPTVGMLPQGIANGTLSARESESDSNRSPGANGANRNATSPATEDAPGGPKGLKKLFGSNRLGRRKSRSTVNDLHYEGFSYDSVKAGAPPIAGTTASSWQSKQPGGGPAQPGNIGNRQSSLANRVGGVSPQPPRLSTNGITGTGSIGATSHPMTAPAGRTSKELPPQPSSSGSKELPRQPSSSGSEEVGRRRSSSGIWDQHPPKVSGNDSAGRPVIDPRRMNVPTSVHPHGSPYGQPGQQNSNGAAGQQTQGSTGSGSPRGLAGDRQRATASAQKQPDSRPNGQSARQNGSGAPAQQPPRLAIHGVGVGVGGMTASPNRMTASGNSPSSGTSSLKFPNGQLMAAQQPPRLQTNGLGEGPHAISTNSLPRSARSYEPDDDREIVTGASPSDDENAAPSPTVATLRNNERPGSNSSDEKKVRRKSLTDRLPGARHKNSPIGQQDPKSVPHFATGPRAVSPDMVRARGMSPSVRNGNAFAQAQQQAAQQQGRRGSPLSSGPTSRAMSPASYNYSVSTVSPLHSFEQNRSPLRKNSQSTVTTQATTMSKRASTASMSQETIKAPAWAANVNLNESSDEAQTPEEQRALTQQQLEGDGANDSGKAVHEAGAKKSKRVSYAGESHAGLRSATLTDEGARMQEAKALYEAKVKHRRSRQEIEQGDLLARGIENNLVDGLK